MTYRIFSLNGLYYWRLSRPGRPGEESDGFPTADDARADVLAEFPGAEREAGSM